MYPVDELDALKDFTEENKILVNEGGLQFRLKHIVDLQKFLESEVSNYSRCKRKYSITIKIMSGFRLFCDVAMAGGSAVGLGLIAGGITSFVGVPVIALSLGTGIVSVGNDVLLEKLMIKIRKHESISALAEAKLSSVRSLVSKALQDSNISDAEFTQIQQNVDVYKQRKKEMQSKATADVNKPVDIEKLKKDFLERGIKIGKEEREKSNYVLKN